MVCEVYLNMQYAVRSYSLSLCFINEEKKTMIGQLNHVAPDSSNFQRRKKRVGF